MRRSTSRTRHYVARTLRSHDVTRYARHPILTTRLARLRVYPFKSLDGAEVTSSKIIANGSLWRDREYALFDQQGGCVNGKRNAKVHALRVRYDERLTTATFSSALLRETFSFIFAGATAPLEVWLGRHFEQPIFVRRDDAGGFPDDLKAPGPTIVSTATLEQVATWMPELDVASVRDRLRSNLEIGDTPAFWEDRLFGDASRVIPFRVGDVEFEGTNPCARCVVPSRDAFSGRSLPGFAKIVAGRRAATLPDWADRTRFDHYYRLATNTRTTPSETGKVIAVGAAVILHSETARSYPKAETGSSET